MTEYAGTNSVPLQEGWAKLKENALNPLTAAMEDLSNTGGFQTSKKLFDNLVYSQMYALIYNMCTQTPHQWSGELYDRHTEFLNSYLGDVVYPSLQRVESIKGEGGLLNQLSRRAENHGIMNEWLTKFFLYLDRFHVDYNELPSVEKKGILKFKELIFDRVKVPATEMMISLINLERNGTQIETSILKSIVKLYEDMGMGTMDVYNNDFEAALLNSTRVYYSVKSNLWGDDMSTPDYLINAEVAINSEIARVKSYLIPDTESKLLAVVVDELLTKKQMDLLNKENSGCSALLKNEQHDHLDLMYRMFIRITDGVKPMSQIFRQHVTALGQQAMESRMTRTASSKENSDDPILIKDLINIHDTYHNLINKIFNNNSFFQKALEDSFTDIVNQNVGTIKTADLFSTFCDRILKGKEKCNEEENDNYLTKLVTLFSYLNDKDVFAEIYRIQLSKRLLTSKSNSDELEISMIGKLKSKCGGTFTSKMEGMINDLKADKDDLNGPSKKFSDLFKSKRAEYGGYSKMECSVQCLTLGHWPNHQEFSVNIPPILSKITNLYQNFYAQENSGRRLAWIHSLGTCTVMGTFKKGTKIYDLKISTLQACVLLEFNGLADGDHISFKNLLERTNINEEVLKRVVHSLLANKEKVLKKVVVATAGDAPAKPDKSIKNTDSFYVNDNYSSDKKAVTIGMSSLDEVNTDKRVEDDRTQAIQACIVRIMKSRKTLTSQQLQGETLNQLSFFKPAIKQVKRSIENLIERDYLERLDENTFKYLA
jgi:cullin 1